MFTLSGSTNVLLIYGLLLILGTARAFYNTARQAIVPNLVVGPWLPKAITLSVTANQIATIAGPVLGGLLYGVLPTDPIAVLTSAGLLTVVATLAAWLPARRATRVDPVVALRAE